MKITIFDFYKQIKKIVMKITIKVKRDGSIKPIKFSKYDLTGSQLEVANVIINALADIALDTLDWGKVFKNCRSRIDVSDLDWDVFDPNNTTDFSKMFNNCHMDYENQVVKPRFDIDDYVKAEGYYKCLFTENGKIRISGSNELYDKKVFDFIDMDFLEKCPKCRAYKDIIVRLSSCSHDICFCGSRWDVSNVIDFGESKNTKS